MPPMTSAEKMSDKITIATISEVPIFPSCLVLVTLSSIVDGMRLLLESIYFLQMTSI